VSQWGRFASNLFSKGVLLIEPPPPSPLPEIVTLTFGELITSLSAGWTDFKSAPLFGLFFGAVYVLGGIGLVGLEAGTTSWTLAVLLGFSVGLYEVSRRLETEQRLNRLGVLGVVLREKNRQIP